MKSPLRKVVVILKYNKKVGNKNMVTKVDIEEIDRIEKELIRIKDIESLSMNQYKMIMSVANIMELI